MGNEEDEDEKPAATSPGIAEPPRRDREGAFDDLFRQLFGRPMPRQPPHTMADILNMFEARREPGGAPRPGEWTTTVPATGLIAKELDKRIEPLIDKRVKELLAELVVKPLNEVREALRSSNIKYGIKMLDDVVTALESASPKKEPEKP